MKILVNPVIDELSAPLKMKISVGDLPDVKGDMSLLRQVWITLISNAIKFSLKTNKPGIELNANIENSKIIYYIKENGAGFNMQFV